MSVAGRPARSTSPEALPWALAAMLAPLLLASGNVFRTLAWPAGLKPLAAAVGEFEAPSALFRAQDLALLGAGILTAAFFLGPLTLFVAVAVVLTGVTLVNRRPPTTTAASR